MIGHVFLDGSQAHPLQTWESGLPVKVRKLSLGYFFQRDRNPSLAQAREVSMARF